MWRITLITAVMAWICATASFAKSDTQLRAERADAAFAAWLKARNMKGVLVLRRGGREVAVIDQGLAPSKRVELASVSKSITGVCAAELVKSGAIKWSDRFSDIVGKGPSVTFEQLIAQSSGLKKDSTQALMRRSLDAKGPHKSDDVLAAIVKRGGPSKKPGRFRYNNENYALAALMIERASGQSYDAVCTKLALRPAGIRAKPSKRSGAFLPWGGWTMTASDYAKWHAHWFGSKRRTTTHPRATAHVLVNNGIYYGLGTFFRTFQNGNTFWHFGALCFPGRMNAGSYAVSFFADWTAVAAYDGCVIDFKDMRALDNALAEALLGAVK